MTREGRARLALGTLLILLVGIFTLVPIAFVVVGSFDASDPGQPWKWGFGAWQAALHSARSLRAIGYSFLLTIRIPIAVLAGFLIAWCLVRVQIPGKAFIEFALWVAYFLPALPIAVGWILLLHKDYGLVNRALLLLPFVHHPLFNIYSVTGIMWVHLTLTTIPVMMILLAPALRQFDATLEQSAKVCGSGSLQTLRRIVVPILAPALLTGLLAGFIRGLEAFEVEQILGVPVGIFVYPTRIYNLIGTDPPAFPQAMALSTILLVILFVLTLVYQVFAERTKHATMTGRGMSFGRVQIGRWRYLASALCLTYIAIGIGLPLGLLLIGSFMNLFGFFFVPDPFTIKHWEAVLRDPTFAGSFWNSLVVGFGVAGLGAMIYALLAYVMARSNLPGRKLLSVLVWLPWSVPGILLGMSVLWLVLSLPGLRLLYGTLGALILALIIQNMPLGTQMLKTSFAQIANELEQASTVCGAGWLMTYRRIMLPLIAPMFVSIFLLTFMGAIRDISTTVLLAGARTRPLSLLMMEFANAGHFESAAVIGVILSVIAVGVTLILRQLGFRVMAGIGDR